MPDQKEPTKNKKRHRKPPPPPTASDQPPAQTADPSKVDLCEACIYDRDTCGTDEADVGYVDDKDGQRVTSCKVYVPANAPPPAPDSAGGNEAEEAYNCPEDCLFRLRPGAEVPDADIRGCTIEGELGVPDGTRFDPDETLPMCPKYTQTPQGPQAPPSTPVGARPEEELGSCTCGWPLKRTPFTHKHDAVRCINPRCNQYRNVIKRIAALTMSERLEMSRSKGDG